MEDIYLIPIRLKPLNFTIQNIYLKDIYYIYPKEYEEKIGNICIRTYKEKDSNYDVIHIGEVIDKIKEKLSTAHITFLKTDDVVIIVPNPTPINLLYFFFIKINPLFIYFLNNFYYYYNIYYSVRQYIFKITCIIMQKVI